MENFVESEWKGFKQISFDFEDRKAIIVFPHNREKQGRWLLKTEFFKAFPAFEIEMLNRGWHLAYVSNTSPWRMPEDDNVKARFCEFLRSEYNLSNKCVPVGMSCGGMHAVYFASNYPQYISALYLDAPVLNLLSCPCDLGVGSSGTYEDYFKVTGYDVSFLLNYREHPIDMAPKLLQNNIPIMLVCGDSDTVVPYCENGEVLYNYYKANGGTIDVIVKPGCNHHPHGLEDNTPIIDFVLKYS